MSKSVEQVISNLMPSNDKYLSTHKKRFIRTLEILLERDPSGLLLELGHSRILPIALQNLSPSLDIHSTIYSTTPFVSSLFVSLGEESREISTLYYTNFEENKFPAADETYDIILCTEVIEHMEQDPMFLFSEVNRLLKTNGLLLVTTPNIHSSRNITKMLSGADPYFYMQYRSSGSRDRHNYEYSVLTLSNVVSSAGFNVEKIWTEDTFEPPLLEHVNRLRSIGYALPEVGDNIFCVARKDGPVRDRYPSIIYCD